MNDHYYSEHPHSASCRGSFHTAFGGRDFSFVTDSGVFSKQGIDFGSRLLIESFCAPNIDGPILDMGCGYGPIGIVLSLFNRNRSVRMADINERAVALAAENARLNRSDAEVIQSNLFAEIGGLFAAIVSNPPIRAGKKVVYQIFSDSCAHLKNGGEFWTVIQKKQGAPSAQNALQSLFPEVDVVARKKGYHVFRAKKI